MLSAAGSGKAVGGAVNMDRPHDLAALIENRRRHRVDPFGEFFVDPAVAVTPGSGSRRFLIRLGSMTVCGVKASSLRDK